MIAIVLTGLIWAWFQFGLTVAMILAMVAAFLLAVRPGTRPTGWLLLLLAGIVIVRLEVQLGHPLPAAWQHRETTLSLCIEQTPHQYADGTQSALATVKDQPPELSLRRVKFWFYGGLKGPDLRPGDCLLAEARLRQPVGRLIPGTFNADRYNFAEHIDAYATLTTILGVTQDPDLQQSLYLNVSQRFSAENALDLWAALALGWSRALSPDLKSVLANNQLMHLFVISGMHLAFVALVLNSLIRFSARLFSPWVQIDRSLRLTLTLGLAFGYVAFLGFPIPVTRALLMLGIPLIGEQLAVRWGRYTTLGWAAVLIILWQPASWLALGPWLSFISVFLILLIFHWRLLDRFSRTGRALLFQGMMSVSILPWALISGLSLNPLAIFTSLILTLLIATVGLPLAFIIALTAADWPVWLWEQGVQLLLPLLTWTAESGSALNYYGFWPVILVLVVAFWAAWRRDAFSALMMMPFIVSLCLAPVVLADRSVPSLTLFDVGHGQALLIQTGSETILYDTAGNFSPEKSLAEMTLDRVLPELDALIVSHSDSDHAAGTAYFRHSSPGLPIWSGQPDRLPEPETIKDCHSADLLYDGVQFLPIPASLRVDDDNNQSCVVLLQLGNHRVLITGDADKYIEYYLLQSYPELFPVDALVLGHHGSASSSAGEFLMTNQDAVFLLSSGDRLSPRWPAVRVADWFEDHDKKLWSSAQSGTIRLQFRASGIRLKTWDTAYRNRLIY